MMSKAKRERRVFELVLVVIAILVGVIAYIQYESYSTAYHQFTLIEVFGE